LGDRGLPELQPGPGEDLCFLSGDFRLFQRQDGHRWSLDDLVTAWFSAQLLAFPPDQFLDLGCGIGSVLMMTAWSFPEAKGIGIEAQAISAHLARRSLAYNGLESRIELIEGDFRQAEEALQNKRFSLITGTPPYFDPAAAVQSAKPQCAPCRFEHRGGVEAYCEVAARHLAPEGVFVMVAATPQAKRVRQAAESSQLNFLQQLDVLPKEGKDSLISLFAMSNGDAQLRETRFLAPSLLVRDQRRQWTLAFQNVRAAMGMPTSWPAANRDAAT
jgi:tRNA1Val (adenine37-N6)-methyltransferase